MYDEKPREYEEFEDICDVRGFEYAEDDRKMDCGVEYDDIKCCNTFDNTDCIEIEQPSYSKECCNNHAEFIISSFEECCEEKPCIEQCKCNVEEKCKDDYDDNEENCLENDECKPKKYHKKPRKRPCMEYQKGMQAGYRMGYMKAQQEFRRKIMYMYNMFQCR